VDRPDLAAHPRARSAGEIRDDLRVLGYPDRARDALGTIASGQLVVAAVSPGNAASLRALLSAGFDPVGSMQLFCRTSAQ